MGGDIERFRAERLIVGEDRRDDADVSYEYIRHRRGPGASDDAAIVAAGFLWGLGVAVGVFFADAIDTLEKYVPVYGDQDEDIAVRIEAATRGNEGTGNKGNGGMRKWGMGEGGNG